MNHKGESFRNKISYILFDIFYLQNFLLKWRPFNNLEDMELQY
jgi:hypothetical protein